MTNRNGLCRVRSVDRSTAIVDIVFIHGLDGNAFEAWSHNKAESGFWPMWLSEELPATRVWTYGYEISSLRIKGQTMPMQDRAVAALDMFTLDDLGKRPLIFVCHSYGGLLLKQILRIAQESSNQEYRRLAESTKGIVFIATPHTGSSLATFAAFIGSFIGASVNLEELKAGSPLLRDLHEWFRSSLIAQKASVLAFFENQKTNGVLVVSEDSANPDVPGARPIPIDSDHCTIARPSDRNSHIYRRVKKLIEDIAAKCPPTPSQGLEDDAGERNGSVDLQKYRSSMEGYASKVSIDGKRVPLANIYVAAIAARDGQPVLRSDLATALYIEGPAGFGKTVFVRHVVMSVVFSGHLQQFDPLRPADDAPTVVRLLTESFEDAIGFSFVSKAVREADFAKRVSEWFGEGRDLSDIANDFASDFKALWARISNEQADSFSKLYAQKLARTPSLVELFPDCWKDIDLPLLIELRAWRLDRFSGRESAISIQKLLKDGETDFDAFFELIELAVSLQGSELYNSAKAIRNILEQDRPEQRLLIIFDGIDELPTTLTVEGLEIHPKLLLMTLIARAGQILIPRGHRILVTGRPGDPGADQVLVDFDVVRLQELSDGWKRRFVYNLFRTIRRDEAPQIAKMVQNELHRMTLAQGDIYRLSGIPLLLTGIALLVAEGRIDRNTNKLDLIDKWVTRLLSKRFPEVMGEAKIQTKAVLAELAASMHSRGVFRLDEEDAFLSISSREYLQPLDIFTQSGLVDFKDGHVEFLHRTFQSYFYAWRLYMDLPAKTSSREIAARLLDFTDENVSPEVAAEPLCFFLGMLLTKRNAQNATQIILDFIEGRMLGKYEGIEGGDEWPRYTANILNFANDCGLNASPLNKKITDLCSQQLNATINGERPKKESLELWLYAERHGLDRVRPGCGTLDGREICEWVPVENASEFLFMASHLTTVNKFEEFSVRVGFADHLVLGIRFDKDFNVNSVEPFSEKVPRLSATSTSPITFVSWFEAITYCNWLNAEILRGESLSLPTQALSLIRSGKYQIRLPTHVEWMVFASRDYAFANSKNLVGELGWANSKEQRIGRPTPVGIFPSNSGVFDLVGNVREWGLPSEVRLDKNGCQLAPLFGGAWNISISEAQEVLWLNRNDRNGKFGFRVFCGPVP